MVLIEKNDITIYLEYPFVLSLQFLCYNTLERYPSRIIKGKTKLWKSYNFLGF